MSTFTKELNDRLNVYAGVDLRSYVGTHNNRITDLFNGAYYIDPYRANVKAANNSAAADPLFKYQKLSVGDIVRRDYDGHVNQGGVFGQAEYDHNNLTAFVSGSLSYTNHGVTTVSTTKRPRQKVKATVHSDSPSRAV